METSRKQRIVRKHEDARREILDATRDVLLRDGAVGITIARVAAELGMSKGALYYYFENKDALIEAFLRELAEDSVAPLRAAVSDAPDGLSAIDALMRAFVDEFRDSLGRFRALFITSQLANLSPAHLQAQVDQAMTEVFAIAAEKLATDMAQGLLDPSVHPRRAAVTSFFAAFGLVSAMSLFEASGTSSLHQFDDLLDELTSIFARGCSA